MAQIASTRLEYLGSIKATAGKEYLASDFGTSFSGATTFIMKSKGNITNGTREPINISINGTPTFMIEYGEINAFDLTRSPSLKYSFSQDCIIVVAKELATL